MRARLVVAFAAVYLIWGSTFLTIRYALETLPPFLMAGFRFVVPGVLLYAWLRLRGAPRPARGHWKNTAFIGGLLLLGGNGGVSWAQQRVPSGIAALMIGFVPLWMVLLDWLRPGGKRPGAPVLWGLALGVTGMILLTSPWNAGAGVVDPAGAWALIAAALSWAVGSLYSRSAKLPSSLLMATAMEMMAGGVLLIAVGSLFGEWRGLDLAAVSAKSWASLAYLAIVGALVAFTAYAWLLQNTTAAKAATYAFVNPVIAVFLGWWVAGETLGSRTLGAAAFIIGAVVLIVLFRTAPRLAVDASKGRMLPHSSS